MTPDGDRLDGRARTERLVARLRAVGDTVAVAESLTGGLVCARLVEVPGVSAVLRGGVVAYASDLKHALLGVDAGLLAEHGAVHAQVAVQMARGVAGRCGSAWGLATTGVAGPDPQDGRAPGTVHVAVWSSRAQRVRSLVLAGDRAQVRAAATEAVLDLLVAVLDGAPDDASELPSDDPGGDTPGAPPDDTPGRRPDGGTS